MWLEIIDTVGGIAGIVSVIGILGIWFFKLGALKNKVDMMWEIIVPQLKIGSFPANPSPEKVFSSLPPKTQKYVKKIGAQKQSLEWKVSAIVSKVGIEKMKNWTEEEEVTKVMNSLAVLIKKSNTL